jgi:putative FmdB family regulatory protein
MPTYRYRCAECGTEFEQWQSFDERPLITHGDCGGKLTKVFSTPGIVLKGSGFYRTDSRNGSASPAERRETSAAGSSKVPDKEPATSDSSSSDDSKGDTPAGAKGSTKS